MKTVLKHLKQIDKMYHLIAGLLVYEVCVDLLHFPMLCAMVAVAIVALGKEIVDEIRYGGLDLVDAAFTVAGGAAMLILDLLRVWI